MAGIVDELQIRPAGKDRRIQAGAFAIWSQAIFIIPTDVKRVAPARGDRQAGPERRTEHRRRVLADAAAEFKLCAILDDRIALHKAVLLIDRADILVE